MSQLALDVPGLRTRNVASARTRNELSPPRSVFEDLDRVFAKYGRARARGGGRVGNKTAADRRKVLKQMIQDVRAAGFKLKRIHNLRWDHLRAYLEALQRKRLKPASVATLVSHVRQLCSWIEKPQLVCLLDEYLARRPELVARAIAARADKSFSGNGVDIAAVIARAATISELLACQLALQWAFGLRPRESWLFRPHMAELGDGSIQIRYGTKGGRPRSLPSVVVLNPETTAVLERAKALAPFRASRMVPETVPLKVWSGKYYRMTKKLGLTRRELRVTSYGLRHERAQEAYGQLTGTPAPIRVSEEAWVAAASDGAARDVVAEFLGHSRRHIASAYLGSSKPRT